MASRECQETKDFKSMGIASTSGNAFEIELFKNALPAATVRQALDT
jgi:hypothetical protein